MLPAATAFILYCCRRAARAASLDAATALARHNHGFEFPISTPGFHTGLHFLRIESIAEIPAGLAELSGEDVKVLRYLDV